MFIVIYDLLVSLDNSAYISFPAIREGIETVWLVTLGDVDRKLRCQACRQSLSEISDRKSDC